MQTTTDTIPATCDDFHAFGPPALPTTPPATTLPNASAMGVVTLGEGGTFISSRPLNEAELAEAWAKHRAKTP